MSVTLRALEVSKKFGHLDAVLNVSMELMRGRVMGLVGDNGSGKSTLVKILSGVYKPSSGTIYVGDVPVEFSGPAEARALGIETIYQDLALALHLRVAENIFLGRELTKRQWWGKKALDRARMRAEAQTMLARVGITKDIAAVLCEELSGGERQAAAVARAVAWGSRAVLMDEPTAALGVEEQEQVLRLVRRLAGEGVAVLLISHNLLQVDDVSDDITVLYHGKVAGVYPRQGRTVEGLISAITGAHSRQVEANSLV